MRGALSRRLTGRFFLTLCALSVPLTAYADAKHHASGGHHGLTAEVWLVLALILLAAKAGGELAERIGQPPVLGELAAGIFLGNLNLVGVHALDTVPEMSAVILLAELRSDGVAVVMSTHDLAVAHLACGDACVLNRHQIAFGPTEVTLTPGHLRAAYGANAVAMAGDAVIVAEP